MLISMQANCNDFSDAKSSILSSNMLNKAYSVDYINPKLDYQKQSESPDTETRDHSIVGFCVKKHAVQSDLADTISVEANTRPSAGRNISLNRIELQQTAPDQSDFKLNRIPSTLRSENDFSSKLLNSTNSVTSECLIRPEVTDIVVTKSSEAKQLSKTGKRTLSAAKSSIRLKHKKGNRTKNNSVAHFPLFNDCANTNNSNNGPDLKPGEIPLDCHWSNRSNTEADDIKLETSERNKKSNVAVKKKSENLERNNRNNQLQPQITAPKNNIESSNFVQNQISNSSRTRYYNLKVKSGLIINKKSPRFRSAIDLSQPVEKREERNSNPTKPPLVVKKNALSSRCRQSENDFIQTSLDPQKSKVASDKKRLCKSLSNLTADDVLSVPCSSIFDRKPTPPYIRKNLGISQIDLNLDQPVVTSGCVSKSEVS